MFQRNLLPVSSCIYPMMDCMIRLHSVTAVRTLNVIGIFILNFVFVTYVFT